MVYKYLYDAQTGDNKTHTFAPPWGEQGYLVDEILVMTAANINSGTVTFALDSAQGATYDFSITYTGASATEKVNGTKKFQQNVAFYCDKNDGFTVAISGLDSVVSSTVRAKLTQL